MCRRALREFGIQEQDVENLARNFNQRHSMALQKIDDDWSIIGDVERRNNEFRVDVVFKLPNSIIEQASSNDVFDVLEQFVSEFGMDIRIGHINGLLIRDVVIRLQPGQNEQELLAGGFPRSGEFIPLVNITPAQNPDGERALRINYAFCIDVGRYRGIIS